MQDAGQLGLVPFPQRLSRLNCALSAAQVSSSLLPLQPASDIEGERH